MSGLDLVAIAQAMREAAEQIRALPDGELVAMALRAQQTSEAGRKRSGSTSRRAEAPKSPASTPAVAARIEQALVILSRASMKRDDLTRQIGISRTGTYVNKLFAALREHPRVKAPQSRGGVWSLK